MRILVRAAGKLPPDRAARAYTRRTVRPPFVTERLMGLHVLVVRAEIISVNPRLNDLVLLQRVHGLYRPIGFSKPDIAVAPGHVAPVRKLARDITHAQVD